MPVLLADAADCSHCWYWGLLEKVQVQEGFTAYTYPWIALRELPGNHNPQELTLRNSGKKIAPNFIRPYAICLTPSFLTA